MSSQNTDKLAVLFDADNAQASVIAELWPEVASQASTVKRVYGDWTTLLILLDGEMYCMFTLIQPIQQFRYTMERIQLTSALIIDA